MDLDVSEQDDARARLAAAAPDLYRALEVAERVLEDVLQQFEGNPADWGEQDVKRIQLQAIDALRKARGEQSI